jgi:large subunit ribosomal protein L31
MKAEIHPAYEATNVTCSCGAAFVTRSTVSSGAIHVDVCSVCHPFYTGKQRTHLAFGEFGCGLFIGINKKKKYKQFKLER